MTNRSFNLLCASDKNYYEEWGINFLKTLHHHVPWLKLHYHLINCDQTIKLPYVDYTHETTLFLNDDQKLGYLQAARFLIAAKKFINNESLIVLDCDCLCVRPFSEKEFVKLFDHQYVLRYNRKDNRWMAGFITFKDNFFRQEYVSELNKKPVSEWLPGWDQEVLKNIAEKYNFVELSDNWLSLMKYNGKSYFFTGKGGKKFKENYLSKYNFFIKRDLGEKNANIVKTR